MRLTGLADLTSGLTDLNPRINTSHFNQIFGFLNVVCSQALEPGCSVLCYSGRCIGKPVYISSLELRVKLSLAATYLSLAATYHSLAAT